MILAYVRTCVARRYFCTAASTFLSFYMEYKIKIVFHRFCRGGSTSSIYFPNPSAKLHLRIAHQCIVSVLTTLCEERLHIIFLLCFSATGIRFSRHFIIGKVVDRFVRCHSTCRWWWHGCKSFGSNVWNVVVVSVIGICACDVFQMFYNKTSCVKISKISLNFKQSINRQATVPQRQIGSWRIW